MPRIAIRTLPFRQTVDIPLILKTLGAELSESLNLDPGRITIFWEFIPANQFMFNGDLAEFQPRSTHHPMVDITLVEGVPEGFEQKLATTIAGRLSRELDVDYHNICVVINTLPARNLFLSGDFVKR